MSTASFILLAGDRSWMVGKIMTAQTEVAWQDAVFNIESTATEIAASVDGALDTLGYTGQPCLLAPPAAWCLAAPIALTGAAAQDHQAMTYQLEGSLPLAAEAIVADFVIHPQANSALGVCVRLGEMSPIIAALESRGIAIQSIVPAALLAGEYLLRHQPSQTMRLLILAEPSDSAMINFILAAGGVLLQWETSLAGVEAIGQQVELVLASVPAEKVEIAQMGLSAAMVAELRAPWALPITDIAAPDVRTAAARGAASVLLGAPAWIDLRRGALAVGDSLRLYRRPLNRLLAMAVVCLLAFGAALLVLGIRYDRMRQDYDEQLRAAFAHSFPGWAMPTNIRAIVASEHRRAVAALRPALGAPGSGDGLQTLFALVTHLPPNPDAPAEGATPAQGAAPTRYAISRFSAEPNAFEIEGEMKSYEEADVLAAAVRGTGMHIASPVARRNADGLWTFVLSGSRASAGVTMNAPAKLAFLDSRRATVLLSAMIALLAIVLLLLGAHVGSLRRAAIESADDLAAAGADMDDLAAWRGGSAGAGNDIGGDESQQRAKLRAAASAGGIAGQLISVEPGKPVNEADHAILPVYVRLGAVTLKQLFTFGFGLRASDPTVRLHTLEIASPSQAPSDHVGDVPDGETWTADLTLEYVVPGEPANGGNLTESARPTLGNAMAGNAMTGNAMDR